MRGFRRDFGWIVTIERRVDIVPALRIRVHISSDKITFFGRVNYVFLPFWRLN
jgi:hypothetical protein